jgi:hypothetical protein
MPFLFFEKVAYFDKNTLPVSPLAAIPPERIKPLAKRRRYAHTFSSGRRLKLVRGVSGQNRWRVVPDGAIVHYGKQFSKNKKKRVSKKKS